MKNRSLGSRKNKLLYVVKAVSLFLVMLILIFPNIGCATIAEGIAEKIYDRVLYEKNHERTLLFSDETFMGHTIEVYEIGMAIDWDGEDKHRIVITVNGVDQFLCLIYSENPTEEPATMPDGCVSCLHDTGGLYDMLIYNDPEKRSHDTFSFSPDFKSVSIDSLHGNIVEYAYNEEMYFANMKMTGKEINELTPTIRGDKR